LVAPANLEVELTLRCTTAIQLTRPKYSDVESQVIAHARQFVLNPDDPLPS